MLSSQTSVMLYMLSGPCLISAPHLKGKCWQQKPTLVLVTCFASLLTSMPGNETGSHICKWRLNHLHVKCCKHRRDCCDRVSKKMHCLLGLFVLCDLKVSRCSHSTIFVCGRRHCILPATRCRLAVPFLGVRVCTGERTCKPAAAGVSH